MRSRLLALLLSAVPSLLLAQSPPALDFTPNAGDAPAAQQITLSGSVSARNGDEVRGTMMAKIADGWHVNSAKPLDEFVIPTKLSFANGELVSADYPQHELKSFAFTNGSKLAVYEGTIQIPFVAKLAAGATSLQAVLRYQACNDRMCLPPKTVTADVALTIVAPPTATTATAAPAQPSGNFTPLTAAPTNAQPNYGTGKLAETFAAKGLPLTLALLFLGGLALNLTPCVFPLIPITLGFFAMQSDGRRGRRFALSAMYVLGIVATYSTLGLVAAIGGKMFGAWLQYPAVLIGFAILMLVLSSSMFGAFEIQPPRWIANRSQGRAGLAGALIMGLAIGIVAAPCVGPVVIALMELVAHIAKPAIGLVMFAALGFGLGFPYLVALNSLPRPGEWMVTVKKGLGFVLVAMAFYFLRPLSGDVVFRWGVALSLLIGAAFLLLSRSKGARVLRLAVGALLLIAGVAFAIPRSKGAEVTWQKYDAKLIADAKASGKPVLIDFYADWCLPCKELDEKTFSDAKVAAELQRFVRIKGDLTTADDAQTRALTKQYAIIGVPTIVLIDSTGNEHAALRLTGFEPPDTFLTRLQRVR